MTELTREAKLIIAELLMAGFTDRTAEYRRMWPDYREVAGTAWAFVQPDGEYVYMHGLPDEGIWYVSGNFFQCTKNCESPEEALREYIRLWRGRSD